MSCADSRGILCNKHMLREVAGDLGGDIDLVCPEGDEAAVARARLAAEAPHVVADEVQRAESMDKATDHALARGEE